MSDRRLSTFRTLTVLMTIAPLLLAPVGFFGPADAADGQRWCLESMQMVSGSCCQDALAEPNCCDREGADSSSGSSPDPCRGSGSGSCCIALCGGVVLGPVDWAGGGLVETVRPAVAVVVHAPAYPGWRDPLLRPPIC